MTQVVRTQKAEAIAHFQYEGRLIQDVPFGNGHINDTYLLTFEVKRMGILKVILQKMNKNVFKNPVELMENILGVPRRGNEDPHGCIRVWFAPEYEETNNDIT